MIEYPLSLPILQFSSLTDIARNNLRRAKDEGKLSFLFYFFMFILFFGLINIHDLTQKIIEPELGQWQRLRIELVTYVTAQWN